ncbi:MAG: hypothetical protein WCS15_04715 [Prevotella sp.]
MEEKSFRLEDIPNLLVQILFELKRINNGPGVDDKTPAEIMEKVEPEKEPEQEKGITHDDAKDMCLKLNRKDPANKRKIKKIIGKYTDGKLADISNADLPKFKEDLVALDA